MPSSDPKLSHLDQAGAARMVDIGDKNISKRRAVAEAVVRISAELERAIRTNALKKGDLISVARLAGIQAAKRTDELIPLCHSLPLDHLDVRIDVLAGSVRIEAEASTTARTGVEMEALVAASIAALTVIDMGKSIDKGIVVERVRLLEKSGGASGAWKAIP